MNWKQLLAQRKVQLHTTSKQELDGLRALIERDLTDAALAGLSAAEGLLPRTTLHSRAPKWSSPALVTA
jgi:hypothetical protein